MAEGWHLHAAHLAVALSVPAVAVAVLASAYPTLGADFIEIWRDQPAVRYLALGLAVWVGIGVGALVFEAARLGCELRR